MTADLVLGTAAALAGPAASVVVVAQAVPGNEAMGPVLSGVAQFGSVALVGALLAWEMIYRGPAREKQVASTHKEHQAEVRAVTEKFLEKMDAHSVRYEAALDRNTTATRELTAAWKGAVNG